MKLVETKYVILIFCICVSLIYSAFSSVHCQVNSTKRYDELINAEPIVPVEAPTPVLSPTPQLPSIIEPTVTPQITPVIDIPLRTHTPDTIPSPTPFIQSSPVVEINQAQSSTGELSKLLPKLDDQLYKDWHVAGQQENWNILNEPPSFLSIPKEVIGELGLKFLLKQTYTKASGNVNVIIYEFNDFIGAYSAYTALHKGSNTKLKVGKNASESENLINFWKGNYYVDVNSSSNINNDISQFIKIASQEISENIKVEQLPPVVAIQLPSLNRIQGTEKYCLGPVCCMTYLSVEIPDLNFDSLRLNESGGLITAQYQLIEYPKDQIKLVLIRYRKKETAIQTFDLLKEKYQNKKLENKDMDIDFDIVESLLKIKNRKDDYTLLKQKGNLLGIVFGATNKKSGEKVLDLVPWPIEIVKPQ